MNTQNNNQNIDDNAEQNAKVRTEKIVFESKDGNEEFYVLEQVKLCGTNYILVTEDDEYGDDKDDDDGSFLILKEVSVPSSVKKTVSSDENFDDIASYEILEDENELKAVLKLFSEVLEDFDLEV